MMDDEIVNALKEQEPGIQKYTVHLESKFNLYDKQLTKAIEIIKGLVDTPMYYQMGGETYENEDYKELISKAEQFLRETDIDNAIKQTNESLDLNKIADEIEQDLKR